MLQMIKRDYLINGMYFLFITLAIPFIYIVNISPIFVYFAIVVGAIFNVFYYDDHNHVGRFIVSMPIKRKRIVFARYLFLLKVIVFYLLYLWLVDKLTHHFLPMNNLFPEISFRPINFYTVLVIFLAISVITAVTVPIYYYFQSFIKSLIAQGVLLFAGIFGITFLGRYLDLIPEAFIFKILDIVDWQPMLIIIAISLICLYISYQFSSFIFSKRDLI